MAGAGTNHNRITTNIAREFGNHLKSTPCEPFASEMKVKVEANYFYPDVMVVCDHQANESVMTDSPLIIVEVLSKATRKIDHTLKRLAYQSIATLEEYILIEQDFVDVDVCRKKNHWQSEHFYIDDEVRFDAIDLQLPVVAIYDRVSNGDMAEYIIQQSAVATPSSVEEG